MSRIFGRRRGRGPGNDDESIRRYRLRRRALAARWLASLSLLALALTLFSGYLLESLAPRFGAEAGSGLGGVLARGLAKVGLDTPDPGFLAEVLSTPPGATVLVDGHPRGTTPFFGNVTCRRGETVPLEVRLDGFEAWRREVPCRERRTLRAHARLERRADSPG